MKNENQFESQALNKATEKLCSFPEANSGKVKFPAVIIMMAMANGDFIPGSNPEFDTWQDNFMTVMTANIATIGVLITDQDYVDLLALQTDWDAKWAAGKPGAATRTHGKTIAMQDSRKAYEPALRDFNQAHIAHNKAVDNELKADLGTTIPDETKTETPLPEHAPIGTIVEIGRLYHKIEIQNPDTPDSKEIPTGIKVLVFRAIVESGGINADTHFELLGSITTHFYKSEFEPADERKAAYYYLVYENPKGERGSPSEIFNAIIA